MRHLCAAILATLALAGCHITPLFVTDIKFPTTAASEAPGAAPGGLGAPAIAPGAGRLPIGSAFWTDNPLNDGFFHDVKFGPGQGLGQAFKATKSGRLRAVYVWLGGEIDQAGIAFAVHAHDRAEPTKKLLARGAITEIAGPGSVPEARQCRVSFVPPPEVVADRRYMWTVSAARAGVVFELFRTKTDTIKDSTSFHAARGWDEYSTEGDFRFEVEIADALD